MSPIWACGSASTGASPSLADRREIDAFAAELIDRFGAAAGRGRKPAADHRDQALVPRGRGRAGRGRAQRGGDHPARQPLRQPGGLVELIQRNAGTLKLRPDQKIVYLRNWDDEKQRLDRRRPPVPGPGQNRPRARPRKRGGIAVDGAGTGQTARRSAAGVIPDFLMAAVRPPPGERSGPDAYL